MVEEFAWLSWFVPMMVTTLMGIMIFVNRSAFRRGSVETGFTGRSELNATMVTNAIKEIEALKIDIRCLRKELQERNIESTRLEERIKYIQERIDDIIVKMENTEQERRRRDGIDDRWRSAHQ
jgi:peptidoglycan hydrolase CwlO-like protein